MMFMVGVDMKRLLQCFTIFIVFCLSGLSVGSQDSVPILKINTKFHTASIRKIRTDVMGTYLATVSYDQTVKIWDTLSGDLLATLHPPIGKGNEGKLYAVALSPDGKFVACGGYTGKSWGGQFAIYVFNWQTGSMVYRLGGLPTPVLELAYSPDGNYLVAGLAKKQGIRVYNARDYSIALEDFQYGGSVYGVDFDSKGRLVTVSDDGYLRLYDQQFALLKKRKTAGKAPFSVSFTPDGSRIAVGYLASRRVDIYSGTMLKFLLSASVRGITNGNLSSVAWLSDGTTLCAAGRWSKPDGTNPIRCWKNKGAGKYRDFPTKSRDTILSLESLPNSQLAFASGDPAMGIINANGSFQFVHLPDNADFRDKQEKFFVNKDGSEVFFEFYWAENTYKGLFSIPDRYLEINPQNRKDFYSPITNALPIRNWKKSGHPRLGKKRLALAPYERSYCLAISPDKQGVVIGAEWSLRYFDRSGNLMWKVTTPAPVRAVNISRDRRLVVAAYADGAIRWHRLRDGRQLLSLFFIPKSEQWVMWSPSGYYDASAGADQFIGWHVNRAFDIEADFFPIGRFRSIYYRPDLPLAILKTLDEQEALRYAAKEWGRKSSDVKPEEMLPPVVRLLDPPKKYSTSEQILRLRFSMRSTKNAPVNTVKIMIDGRPVKVEEGTWAAGEEVTREATITIPPKDSIISVIAINRFAASEPAIAQVHFEAAAPSASTTNIPMVAKTAVPSDSQIKARSVNVPAPEVAETKLPEPTAPQGFLIKPKLYVLAVGIGKYPREEMMLMYPAKDARDFARMMQTQNGKLYRDVQVRVITDEQATRENIIEGLDWIRKETTARDVAMIFMAGHGLTDNRSGTYYFLPVDANPEKLMVTGIPATYLQDTVASIPGKVLLFLDACYSANILKGRRTRGIAVGATGDVMGVVNELVSAENGAVVFASSSRTQRSLESEEWQNGAFTKALLEGLSGKADLMKKGKITIDYLDLYISERVKELTKGEQTPIVQKPQTVQDFPIAITSSS